LADECGVGEAHDSIPRSFLTNLFN
jgi:hypothetical protein